MSKRSQRTKAKGPLPAEGREDTESDSSSLDAHFIMQLFDKLEERSNNRKRMGGSRDDFREWFDDVWEQALKDREQRKKGKVQQRASELERRAKKDSSPLISAHDNSLRHIKPVLASEKDNEGLRYGRKDVCQNGLRKADQPSDGARSHQRVESAPVHEEVLGDDENLCFPSRRHHKYADGFALVDVLSPMAFASTNNSLLAVRLSEPQLLGWSESRKER